MSKQDDILVAAERLFYEQGFHATGIDAIVEAAGTTPRTLYKHFNNKDALVLAVLKARDERYCDLCETFPAGDRNSMISGFFRASLHWAQHYSPRGCIYIQAQHEYGRINGPIMDYVRAHKSRIMAIITRRLSAHVHRDHLPELTEALSLLIEGATASAPLHGAEESFRTAERLALSFAAENA